MERDPRTSRSRDRWMWLDAPETVCCKCSNLILPMFYLKESKIDKPHLFAATKTHCNAVQCGLVRHSFKKTCMPYFFLHVPTCLAAHWNEWVTSNMQRTWSLGCTYMIGTTYLIPTFSSMHFFYSTSPLQFLCSAIWFLRMLPDRRVFLNTGFYIHHGY